MEQKYETPKELLDFIFIECSEMNYTSNEIRTINIENSKNFFFERIVFAIHLLKEQFNININELNIKRTQNVQIPDGLLETLSLTSFGCINTDLRVLPTLPPTLKYLNIPRNRLTSLPKLPEGLLRLSCGSNSLVELPEIPSSLNVLWCNDNKLTSLPELPHGIELISDIKNINSARN